MNHHRDTGNGHQIRDFNKKMPVDSDLEWVSAVWMQGKGKGRWVRSDVVQNVHVLPRIVDGDFRIKSKFENVAKLLEKHERVDPDTHPGFERGSIGVDLTYYQDALLFMKQIEVDTTKTRYKSAPVDWNLLHLKRRNQTHLALTLHSGTKYFSGPNVSRMDQCPFKVSAP